MALNLYKCKECEKVVRTLKKAVPTCSCKTKDLPMKKQLAVPNSQFNEFLDDISKEKGKAKPRRKKGELRERSRTWTQKNELDDFIQKNNKKEAHQNGWVTNTGKRRRKINDYMTFIPIMIQAGRK